MTFPRRVLPGRLHFVTRRCTQRMLLLTPRAPVNAIVRYALAVVSERYSVRVCAFLASTNHIHAVLEDPQAQLSAFMQDLDQLIARALNAFYGRGENFWSQPDSYRSQELFTPQQVLDKLVYLQTNPVKDGLVAHPDQWPGVLTRPEAMGAEPQVEPRPERAFFGGRRGPNYEPGFAAARRRWRRTRGQGPPQPARAAHRQRPSTLPATAALEVHVPSPFADMQPDAFRRLLRQAVEEDVARIHAERAAEGRTTFLGPTRVAHQDPLASAGETAPDFALTPHLPGRDSANRQQVAELRAFRAAYREAYEAWRQGRRDVLFPPGTYGLRVFHGAQVAPP